ncbi:MAG: hypothetical protein LBR23_02095 [Spirochaetaceae bacterium]|jgi:WD40 repeat protein|nr:hypothetical protein [Spirochaetaceae bacterium]
MKKISPPVLAVIIFLIPLSAFPQGLQKHLGPVSALAGKDGRVFSAGEDGFVIEWNPQGTGKKYQISELQIKLLALHPAREDIAVYETDGFSLHRVSVWDWGTLTRKYEKTFPTAITALGFTKKGSYLAAGSAAVQGVFFFNAATGASVRNLSAQTGVVSFIESSDTEGSCVIYSPSGYIGYYDLGNGRQRAKLPCEPDLSQIVLFGNNLFLAGCRGGELFVLLATTGETLARIPARNPLLSSSGGRLYVAEFSARTGTLKYVDPPTTGVIPQARPARQFTLPERTALSSFLVAGGMYAGAASGNVYAASLAPDTPVSAVTGEDYQTILDLALFDGGSACVLTAASVFLSGGEDDIRKIADNTGGHRNLLCANGSILLWSVNTKKPLVLLESPQFKGRTIYTPANSVTSLRSSGTRVVIVEGNSRVSLYSLDTGKMSQVYTGTGVQDAILAGRDELIIAKTSADNPRSPLISVGVRTQETVRLPLSGEIAFSLTAAEGAAVYGVTISASGNARRTSIFSYNPETQTNQALLTFPDENVDAFTAVYGGILYTNVARTTVTAYNTASRSQVRLDRPPALSRKILVIKNHVASLGTDGGITWYEEGGTAAESRWYLKRGGSWDVFGPGI